MAKTKLDRVLELLEEQAKNLRGNEGMEPTSEPTAQIPATTETTTSDVEADAPVIPTVEADAGEQPTMDSDPSTLPEKSSEAEAPVESESDTFDKDFAELAALVGYDVNATADTNTEKSAAEPDPVDEPLTEEENQNFKKLLDQEIERRVTAEGEARNAAAEAKYRKTMLEKEGDKYYSNIDKQKELEAELRIANAAKMPDQIAPLWQSYLLWKETQTPTHKRRAIKDALTLVEEMTWVSAEDYYWTILRAENKDIPEVNDKASITSTAQNMNGQRKDQFIML